MRGMANNQYKNIASKTLLLLLTMIACQSFENLLARGNPARLRRKICRTWRKLPAKKSI